MHREGMRIALYLGPDRSDLLFAARELARDVQILSLLSMLKLRRFVWYFSNAADVSPFFVYSDEPGTMLVWADCRLERKRNDVQINVRWCCAAGVFWDRSVECDSAGGVVQLYATEISKADRWETLDHRWNQIRWSDAYPETRAKGVAQQMIQAVEKVPDTVDSINNG